MDKKFYTVLINFEDHIVGIDQYESASPEEALDTFIRNSDSLSGYDRDKILKSVNPLIKVNNYKGLSIVSFNESNIGGIDNNPILGGHIVESAADV